VPRPPLEATCGDTRALLEADAVVHGDREAYVEPGGRITFADWVGRACAVALQLAAAGVGKGDVVALWLPSGIDYATCYAAPTMIGAITTGLNPRLGPREIEAVVTQADPSLRWTSAQPIMVGCRYVLDPARTSASLSPTRCDSVAETARDRECLRGCVAGLVDRGLLPLRPRHGVID
jgi:acyl-CoA synthetase (AMP-forming)/AMP-acid ligase II